MFNPYKQLKSIIRRHRIDPEHLVHALMATVYSSCCSDCSSTLRSEEFMKTFETMTAEMVLCSELSKRNVA